MNWRDLLYFSKGERRALALLLCLITISWILLLWTNTKRMPIEAQTDAHRTENRQAPGERRIITGKNTSEGGKNFIRKESGPHPNKTKNTLKDKSPTLTGNNSYPTGKKRKGYTLYTRTEKYAPGTLVELNTADTTILKKVPGLGSTLAAIAAEKSGILKPGCRAVLYGQSREVGEVVARVCAEKEIPLTVTDASQLTLLSSGLDGQRFTYRGSAPLLLPLLGDYQLRNAMTVLDTVDALRAQGRNISADAVARGLAAARWPGRLELVHRRPDLIIDGGHNPQCAQALATSLRGLYGEKKLIFLIGVLADKDWQSMVGEVLPLAKAIVTVRPESERAKDENELAAWVRAQGVPAEAHASIGEALDAALALAGPEDAVCAWGSLYSVGELRHCLGLC